MTAANIVKISGNEQKESNATEKVISCGQIKRKTVLNAELF